MANSSILLNAVLSLILAQHCSDFLIVLSVFVVLEPLFNKITPF